MGLQRLYKAFSPYISTELAGLDHAQTADVVYFFHLNYPVTKLIRSDHTDWTFSEVTFGPTLSPPVGASIAASTPNTTGAAMRTYNYQITAVSDGLPFQESRASATLSVSNDLTLAGNLNTLTLPARPAGVDRYILYREQSGAFGYIGGTSGTTFDDLAGLQPILSDTPPIGDNPFDSADNYPSAGTFHQQRLFMGRTRNVINGAWFTKSANYENMDKSRPVKADDAGAFALVANMVNAVSHLLSLDDLLLFTTDGIWAVTGGDGGVIMPGDINPKVKSGRGASRLKPLPVDNVVFFQPAKGDAIRTLGFSQEIDGYTTNNVAIFSPHLFKTRRIIKWWHQEEPYGCIWSLCDDGVLLCFVWEQEHQVWGWAPQFVEGFIEDICIITELGYDRLYALIRRTINGVERRFHERMALPHGDDIAAACHLDCSITQVYDPPRNRIDQLWHLVGATVSAFYDGYFSHGYVVDDEGGIDLRNGYEATICTVGFRYSGVIETLPPALATAQGSAHTNRQMIDQVVVRALETKGIEIGANGTDLQQIEERDGGEVADLPDVDMRDYPVTPPGNWGDSSTVIIEQNEPHPAYVAGVFYSLKVSK